MCNEFVGWFRPANNWTLPLTGRILVNELDYFSILPQNNKLIVKIWLCYSGNLQLYWHSKPTVCFGENGTFWISTIIFLGQYHRCVNWESSSKLLCSVEISGGNFTLGEKWILKSTENEVCLNITRNRFYCLLRLQIFMIIPLKRLLESLISATTDNYTKTCIKITPFNKISLVYV